MDLPTLPVVGKNCQLVGDIYFSWLGQIFFSRPSKLHASYIIGICIYTCSFNN